MKIAIITFSEYNINYGSCLQAYSLSEYLKKRGHDVKFIKYREFNDLYEGLPYSKVFLIKFKTLIYKIAEYPQKKLRRKIEKEFQIFREQKLPHTRLYTSDEELCNELEEFDCYICGSDQIWNVECLGGIRKPYFLNFAPDVKMKIAYAPSLGEYELEKKDYDILKAMLDRFDKISVREAGSIENVQYFTSKKVEWILDPVFLNNKEFWEEFSGKEPIIKGDYGVSYFVTHTELGKNVIQKMRDKYGMPVYNLSLNTLKVLGTSNKHIAKSPQEFVNLIRNAKFVVGTSFHLLAFATILGIPSIVIKNGNNQNRLESILRLINMEENLISNMEELERILDTLFRKKIDYEKLEEKIEKSKQFLQI